MVIGYWLLVIGYWLLKLEWSKNDLANHKMMSNNGRSR